MSGSGFGDNFACDAERKDLLVMKDKIDEMSNHSFSGKYSFSAQHRINYVDASTQTNLDLPSLSTIDEAISNFLAQLTQSQSQPLTSDSTSNTSTTSTTSSTTTASTTPPTPTPTSHPQTPLQKNLQNLKTHLTTLKSEIENTRADSLLLETELRNIRRDMLVLREALEERREREREDRAVEEVLDGRKGKGKGWGLRGGFLRRILAKGRGKGRFCGGGGVK